MMGVEGAEAIEALRSGVAGRAGASSSDRGDRMDWPMDSRLPPGVAEHLGHYVYMYVHPDTDEPFYVGKGVGDRVLAHLDDQSKSRKSRLLSELRAAGRVPRLEILSHRLKDEETAFRVEAAVIDALGLGNLTNEVRGWDSLHSGRMGLDELAEFYTAQPVTVTDPVLLIRINRLFRRSMTPLELYEATRGIWRLGPRRVGARFALAVFDGLVREVYEVRGWHKALTLKYETRDLSARDASGRWEFDGVVANDEVRGKYRNKSVLQYLLRGMRSPSVYVNVESAAKHFEAGVHHGD
jgi:hypothetical protein